MYRAAKRSAKTPFSGPRRNRLTWTSSKLIPAPGASEVFYQPIVVLARDVDETRPPSHGSFRDYDIIMVRANDNRGFDSRLGWISVLFRNSDDSRRAFRLPLSIRH